MPQNRIDFEPIGSKIDFEPIQFESIQQQEAPSAFSRLKDLASSFFTSPAMQMGNKPTQQQVNDFGANWSPSAGRIIANTIDPTGIADMEMTTVPSALRNLNQGNYGAAAVDAGVSALPLLGLRSLMSMKPRVEVLPPEAGFASRALGSGPKPYGQLPAYGESNFAPQVPASSGIRGYLTGEVAQPTGPQSQLRLGAGQQPKGLLPAIGETFQQDTSTPRFYQGLNGLADDTMAYPMQLQDAKTQLANRSIFNASEPIQAATNEGFPPVMQGRTQNVVSRRPEIVNPNIGAELAVNNRDLRFTDPAVMENPVLRSLLPERLQGTIQEPVVPAMTSKPPAPVMRPNQIMGPSSEVGAGNAQVLPQYARENIQGQARANRPPNVLPQNAREMPRASNLGSRNPRPDENVPNQWNWPPQQRRTPYPSVQPQHAVEVPRASASAASRIPKSVPTTDPNKKPMSPVTQVIGLGKEVAASVDLSAPLRQGINLVHKKEWRDALIPMVKSWAKESNFVKLENEIKSNPHYELGKQSGLSITDRVTAPEDQFISTLAERIPGIGAAFKASNRAYTGFLNKLRQDTFSSLVEAGRRADPNLLNNQDELNKLAEFVNNATGRGKLSIGKKNLEQHAELANNIFFSPRFVASRMKMLNKQLNPISYINQSPQLRKEYLKSLLATSAFSAISLGLSSLLGGEVNWSDPTDSDFLKAKFGNTRIDPSGGYQQYLTAGAKIGEYLANATLGDKDKDYGTFKKPTAYDVGQRFVEGKFNPVIAFTAALARNREFDGTPFQLQSSVMQHFTPMVANDLMELAREDPGLLALFGPPAVMGMGVQTYQPR